VGHRIYFNRYC